MSAVAIQPRMNKLKIAPRPGENQVSFIERCDRELYSRIPDTIERSRFLLQCWSDAGGDRELAEIAANRFPASEFHTVRNLVQFPEHVTTDIRGERRKYDRKTLATIVRRCNERILDTGDFAILSEGHTPEAEDLATGAKMPETLGYVGPFRLARIGNRKPRWAIFADEHYHRSDLEKVKKRPRRSPEVFLDDMILDPIAALGAETPRLDTGIVRNCRKPDGRVVMKYSTASVACYPSAGNTSPQSFRGKKKENYAAGDKPMDNPNSNDDLENHDGAAELSDVGDEQLQKIILGVAAAVMQSKPMQWVVSQMPPDWSPGEGEHDDVAGGDAGAGGAGDGSDVDGQVPGDGTVPGDGDAVPGEVNPTSDVPADVPAEEFGEGLSGGDDTHFDPEAGEVSGSDADSDGVSDADESQGAAIKNLDSRISALEEDAATDDEVGQMDDEEKEKYAAFDSAGRRGFLWSWRRRHKRSGHKYSADRGEAGMSTTATKPAKENYSRLASENQELKTRVETLERETRHKDRYSKLKELRQSRAFNFDSEFEDVKDVPPDAFDKHVRRIKENYSRIPREGEMPSLVTDDEVIQARDKDQTERFSKLAVQRALNNNKDRRNKHMSFDDALRLVISEQNATSSAK